MGEVDTDGVEPLTAVIGQKLRLRADVVDDGDCRALFSPMHPTRSTVFRGAQGDRVMAVCEKRSDEAIQRRGGGCFASLAIDDAMTNLTSLSIAELRDGSARRFTAREIAESYNEPWRVLV